MYKICILTLTFLLQASAWADSGMEPVWVYMNGDGKLSLIRMKPTTGQDAIVTSQLGNVKSKFNVFKENNKIIPRNPTFTTSAICEIYEENILRIKCTTSSGLFSGTSYEKKASFYTDNYVDNLQSIVKGKVKFRSSTGKFVKDKFEDGMKILQYFSRIGGDDVPYGIIGFDVLQCVNGCDANQSPKSMIEIALTGD